MFYTTKKKNYLNIINKNYRKKNIPNMLIDNYAFYYYIITKKES